MEYNKMTYTEIQNKWNEATAALMAGDVAGVEARKNIYEYIRGLSEHYGKLLSTDPENFFKIAHRPYLLSEGNDKDVVYSTPEYIPTRAARWSAGATYKEITISEADAIEEEKQTEAIKAEEEKKKAAFEAIQEYNRTMIQFLKELKPIVGAFSGKVFNKKFDEALSARFPYGPEAKKHIYVDRRSYHPNKEYSRVDLHLSLYGGSSDNYEYIKLYLTEQDGKQPRIDAAKTFESIENKITEINDRIAANNKSLKDFPEEIKKAEAIKKAFEDYIDFVSGMPDQFKKIYKLPHDITQTCGNYNAITRRNER